MDTRELILLPVLKANTGSNGGFVMTRKYMDGAAQYARFWPGPVTSLVIASPTATTDLDHVEVLPGSEATGMEARPISSQEFKARIRDAAAVLAFLSGYEEETARACRNLGIPFFCVSGSTPLSERQVVDANTRNVLLRWRRKLWLYFEERARQRILPGLAGLQCSGTPTFELYKEAQPNSLLFFDNRVREKDVIAEDALESQLNTLAEARPFGLIFGGRHIAMKGVLDLPMIAKELDALSVDFQLDIYGDGPLRPTLAERSTEFGLSERVRLHGALDFLSGWIPSLKSGADLFACPHPQGDPSSTYPEVMSCGLPIVGYNNDAFVGIVKHSNAGWLAPIGNPAALAKLIADIDKDRAQPIQSSRSAREFAQRHTFETTFGKRTRHLIESRRLSNDLKSKAIEKIESEL